MHAAFAALPDDIERRLFASTDSDVERARAAARHLVLAGGKRLRPRLALLVAEAAGLAEDAALTIGTAAELVHAATLLHDDVVDRSDLRRGRATVNAKFGAASAVLTGDFLLAQALAQLLDADMFLATKELSAAVRSLAEAEILQLQQAFVPETTLAQSKRIADGKTAALFVWSARAVAVTADLDAERVAAAGDVGRALGYAFQVADDLLDFVPGGETGKPAFKDLREGQVTIPMQLLRIIDRRFDQALREAFATRDENAVDRAYAILRESRAERLGRQEIEDALAGARRRLDKLAGGRGLAVKFNQFIDDCTRRTA